MNASSNLRIRHFAVALACAATLWAPEAGAQEAAAPPAGTPAGAQDAPPPAPSFATAMGRLQAGDLAGAERELSAITEREPKNGHAWRMLGMVHTRQQHFDQAVAAYERALAVDPADLQPIFRIASAYAAAKDSKRAFEWLAKAKATGKLDMTQIEVAPEFGFLKEDPRFAKLLPRPKDFERPFVEPVTILQEWVGESAGDQFGWIARGFGDVDRDGAEDVVTSAPMKAIGGPAAGRVYVYSAKKGKLLWTADGRPGHRLGTGLEAAGDTNADGVPDVIAAAPGGGVAYVYSGKDGQVLLTLKGEHAGEEFGRHASGVGDVNQDGASDLIVGAPGAGAGESAGRAYVFSGKDGKVLLTLNGERAGDAFGSAVAGRTTGGKVSFLVGAPKAGPRHNGRVYVHQDLSGKARFVIDADETGGALGGMFLSVPGDLDGDGVADVYASDFGNAAKGPATGRVYVHSGKDGRRLLALTGETAGEGFGTSPSNAGDVDGDGHADLIVGSWQYSGAAVGAGRASLYSGKDGSLLRTYTSRIPGDTLGFDAVGLGDVDGDGTVDLLLTSAWSGVRGNRSGRVFVISSGVKKAAPPASASAPSPGG
jgi:hypothetical protein